MERTDLVFSRGASPLLPGSGRYVQQLVAEQGAEIRRWLERGAWLMVCGGLQMAAGVQVSLAAICGQEKLDAVTRAGTYRRDIY